MEEFPSLQTVPQSTMIDLQMDLQAVLMPQQSLLPNSICMLSHRQAAEDGNISYKERRKAKGRDEKEEEDELLFDIDEFLVEEEHLININSDDENEGAILIAKSPTIPNTNSNPSTRVAKESNGITNDPIPATTTTTTTTIINIHNNANINNNTVTQKKKRKRRSRLSRANPKNVDISCVPPKRPLSAYNLYFREKRCSITTATKPTSKTKTKYKFEELGKIIGKGWRELPLNEKRKLEIRAEADRERYRTEMIAYRIEKRRKDREEDEDTLVLMRHIHQQQQQCNINVISRNNNIIHTCPHSPTLQPQAKQQHHYQHPSGSYPPKRSTVMLRRRVTDSPGRQQAPHYPQENQHIYPDEAVDTTRKNQHVRQVSSISPPTYPGDTDYRSRNTASPAVASYSSVSSWSGDEEDEYGRSHSHGRSRKDKNEIDEDASKGRDIITRATTTNNNLTLLTRAVEHLPTPSNTPRPHLAIAGFENGAHKPSAALPHGVPVARVVSIPATDGLQRILQHGLQSYESLSVPKAQQHPHQPPLAWMPQAHGHPQHIYQQHHHQHAHHQQPYATPPSPVASNRNLYSPPPPHGSFVQPASPHYPPPYSMQYPQQYNHEQIPAQVQTQEPPRMLHLGMEIFLRDPTTGLQRAYRVQYTPTSMTAEEANQFQRQNQHLN